jgi:dTDP-glucose 4,6-dehydratase
MNGYIAKNVLVTGGMGFIGSNFIRHLLETNANINIVNLDLGTYAALDRNLFDLPSPERHLLVKGDINNRELVDALLEEYNIDAIVNFAAESHVDRSITNPENFIATNIAGTFSLLEAARHVWLYKNKWNSDNCRFYHISTDEVYGSCADVHQQSFTEESAYQPSSPYSASKAASNHLVNAYFHTYKLPTLISNCTNNYGPRQHPEKLLPKIISCCLNGIEIPIYGNGSNIRDWLFVKDHCIAISSILESGKLGNEYNVSANNELSNIDVVNKICALMDKYVPKAYSHTELIRFIADRPGHDWRYSLNSDKIRRELGWSPSVKFDAGLLQTLEYYLALQGVNMLESVSI